MSDDLDADGTSRSYGHNARWKSEDLLSDNQRVLETRRSLSTSGSDLLFQSGGGSGRGSSQESDSWRPGHPIVGSDEEEGKEAGDS